MVATDPIPNEMSGRKCQVVLLRRSIQQATVRLRILPTQTKNFRVGLLAHADQEGPCADQGDLLE